LSMDKVWEFAKICRVSNVMMPYLESLNGWKWSSCICEGEIKKIKHNLKEKNSTWSWLGRF
jgi:hypothetical protein